MTSSHRLISALLAVVTAVSFLSCAAISTISDGSGAMKPADIAKVSGRWEGTVETQMGRGGQQDSRTVQTPFIVMLYNSGHNTLMTNAYMGTRDIAVDTVTFAKNTLTLTSGDGTVIFTGTLNSGTRTISGTYTMTRGGGRRGGGGEAPAPTPVPLTLTWIRP